MEYLNIFLLIGFILALGTILGKYFDRKKKSIGWAEKESDCAEGYYFENNACHPYIIPEIGDEFTIKGSDFIYTCLNHLNKDRIYIHDDSGKIEYIATQVPDQLISIKNIRKILVPNE